MPISGNDLIEAGWRPGPQFSAMLEAARALEEEKGISDHSYILKLLERDFIKDDPMLEMRDSALPFSEAIEATNELDEKNIDAVRRYMNQLLRTSVIESGSVMPDACPAGSAEATIPVDPPRPRRVQDQS